MSQFKLSVVTWLVLAFAVVAIAGPCPCTKTPQPTTLEHKDWGRVSDADAAKTVSEKRGMPIAILNTVKKSTDQNIVGQSLYFLSNSSLDNMARIVVYQGENHAMLTAAKRDVTKGGGQPQIYFVNPKGRTIGYISNQNYRELKQVTSAVYQIVAWEQNVPRRLEAADRLAEKGRFDSALKQIKKIATEDQQVQAAIAAMLLSDNDRKQQTERERSGITEAPRKQRVKAKRPSAIRPFFPNLLEEKTQSYRLLADKLFAEAKALADKGEFPRALAALRPLKTGPKEFELTEKASQLTDEIYAKIREQREAEREAAAKRAASARASSSEN